MTRDEQKLRLRRHQQGEAARRLAHAIEHDDQPGIERWQQQLRRLSPKARAS